MPLRGCGGASYLPGRRTTQSAPAELEEPPPLDPLPTTTDEPDPPGDTVVLPLTRPEPAVIVVELVASEPPFPVITRQGFPLTIVVPFGPEVTETRSASAGVAMIRRLKTMAPLCMRIGDPPTIERWRVPPAIPRREPLSSKQTRRDPSRADRAAGYAWKGFARSTSGGARRARTQIGGGNSPPRSVQPGAALVEARFRGHTETPLLGALGQPA